jgi:hypothetical protein
MSGRRAFTTAAIGSLIGLRAQAATKSYRIGVLDVESQAEADWSEFVAELARRGYVEGQNLKFEKRFSIPPTQLDAVAKELVGQRVDLIYALGGTASALAATPVLPERDRHLGLLASQAQRSCEKIERATQEDSQLPNTGCNVQPIRCVDRLNPQGEPVTAREIRHRRHFGKSRHSPGQSRPAAASRACVETR